MKKTIKHKKEIVLKTKTITQKLEVIRKINGITQKDLCEKIGEGGIAPPIYSRLVSGKVVLTLQMFLEICKALEVSPEKIIQ